jgi:hypothetical protein
MCVNSMDVDPQYGVNYGSGSDPSRQCRTRNHIQPKFLKINLLISSFSIGLLRSLLSSTLTRPLFPFLGPLQSTSTLAASRTIPRPVAVALSRSFKHFHGVYKHSHAVSTVYKHSYSLSHIMACVTLTPFIST